MFLSLYSYLSRLCDHYTFLNHYISININLNEMKARRDIYLINQFIKRNKYFDKFMTFEIIFNQQLFEKLYFIKMLYKIFKKQTI